MEAVTSLASTIQIQIPTDLECIQKEKMSNLVLELEKKQYKSLVTTSMWGIPHDVLKHDFPLVSHTPKSPLNSVSDEKSANHHLYWVFPVYLEKHGATAIALNYRKSVIHFLRRGVEYDYIPFNEIVKVCRNHVSESNMFVPLLPPKRVDNGSLMTLEEFSLESLDNVFGFGQNKDELSDEIYQKESNLSCNSSIVSHLTLSLYFKSRDPVRFVCSSISSRDHIFNRLFSIMKLIDKLKRDGGLKSPTDVATSPSIKNGNSDFKRPVSIRASVLLQNISASTTSLLNFDSEVILHRAFVSRPTQSGFFTKSVYVVVVPGRVYEYSDEVPKLNAQTQYISTKVMSTNVINCETHTGDGASGKLYALPSVLTHSNICPKFCIPLYNSYPPECDGSKVFLPNFRPLEEKHTYMFKNSEEAQLFFKICCFARNLWEYTEMQRHSQYDSHSIDAVVSLDSSCISTFPTSTTSMKSSNFNFKNQMEVKKSDLVVNHNTENDNDDEIRFNKVSAISPRVFNEPPPPLLGKSNTEHIHVHLLMPDRILPEVFTPIELPWESLSSNLLNGDMIAESCKFLKIKSSLEVPEIFSFTPAQSEINELHVLELIKEMEELKALRRQIQMEDITVT